MSTTELAPLTREQLKALRTASRISFSHTPSEAFITAIHEDRQRDTKTEVAIPVESQVRTSRSHLCENTDLAKIAYGHQLIWVDCGEHGQYWKSITQVIKAGDALSLSWGADYETNGYMEKAGLHGDRLTLIVARGAKKFCFIIYSQCCENNTARMIRRGPFNNE